MSLTAALSAASSSAKHAHQAVCEDVHDVLKIGIMGKARTMPCTWAGQPNLPGEA